MYIGSQTYMSIRPYGIMAYDRHEFTGKSTRSLQERKPKPEAYKGVLSKAAKKKLKKAIQLIVAIAEPKEAINFKTGKTFKFKLNFITLTLPSAQGEVSDKEIKHCLDNWIKRAKRKHNLKSYVWRAERQANGNIHFHIITDTYIHYEKIRNDWNSVINALGFVDRFVQVHGDKIPNSTDVHSINKIKNLSQYFIKYMSKKHKDGEKPIEGKVWDCSTNLKGKDSCTFPAENEDKDSFSKIVESANWVVKHCDFCSIIFFSEQDFNDIRGSKWGDLWYSYLARVRAAA